MSSFRTLESEAHLVFYSEAKVLALRDRAAVSAAYVPGPQLELGPPTPRSEPRSGSSVLLT